MTGMTGHVQFFDKVINAGGLFADGIFFLNRRRELQNDILAILI